MCGIELILSKDRIDSFQTPTCDAISRRGPDAEATVIIPSGSYFIHIRGSVLCIREPLVRQPLVDDEGNCLLWNGEIFGGIQVNEDENDTAVLFRRLTECEREEQVVAVLAAIRGPFAFVYLQKSANVVWFGRDFLGRRSLLWNWQGEEDLTELHVCSVRSDLAINKETKSNVYSELAAMGLYRVDLNLNSLRVELLPFGFLMESEEDGQSEESAAATASLARGKEWKLVNRNKVIWNCGVLARQRNEPDEEAKVTAWLKVNPFDDKLLLSEQVSAEMKSVANELLDRLMESVRRRVEPHHGRYGTNETESRIGILFSGGIDSVLLALLADHVLPHSESIDLLNVAFAQRGNCHAAPDRAASREALKELNPNRMWNLIEIDVGVEELQTIRASRVKDVVYPLNTVLDDSIGCAIWFAARGEGTLRNAGEDRKVASRSKILLVGMGADEQLAGYSRHRTTYEKRGWSALADELEREVKRISSRNLGRDDRVISDHGKEARFPYLDEDVVSFLHQVPVYYKAWLDWPRGIGEKLLLRVCGELVGLSHSSRFPKRAIQFGSRIAKLEKHDEKGSAVCNRLL